MEIFKLDLPIPYHPSLDMLDATKIQAYQSCPRMFFYEYCLGWRSARPSNHLIFGQAVHEALEYLMLNKYGVDSVRRALEIFNEEYRLIFPPATDEIFFPKTPVRFFDLILEYIQHYHDDFLNYDVIKTEFGGLISLSDTHTLAYKMDTIVRDKRTQQYCSLEHKTKGGNYIDKNYIYTFMLNVQLGCYTHVLNCLYPPEDVYGVIINCLCIKRTKTPAFILERFPIPLSNKQMNNWLENTKFWMDLIEKDYQALSETKASADCMTCFPKNGTNCTNWGRVCPYNNFCTTWGNPLRHLHSMPIGMEVSFWSPLDQELTEVVNV